MFSKTVVVPNTARHSSQTAECPLTGPSGEVCMLVWSTPPVTNLGIRKLRYYGLGFLVESHRSGLRPRPGLVKV